MTSVGLLGVGTAVPPHRIGQVEAAHFATMLSAFDDDQARLVSVLYRRAGVRERYLAVLDAAPHVGARPRDLQSLFDAVSPDDDATRNGPTTAARMACYAERAAPLATEAARTALANAGTPVSAITHLVTVSCTGFVAPGVDVALIARLGLCSTVERVHVGFMGCQGALNGLRVARSLVASSEAATVLLCAVELCGLHLQYSSEPDAIVANSLFADGAAACIVGPAPDRDERAWRLRAHGAGLVPDSLDTMTWSIGNHGFAMTLSARVPGLIETHLGPWMSQWLARHELRIADIGSWAIHPGGARIVSAAEKALGLDGQAGAAAREVLAEYGNMSSPTILFVLKRLADRQAARPCVALAFGPGLSIEAALLT